MALSIKTQPLSQTIALGGTLNLLVDATEGSGIYSYQWLFDNSNISDATYNTYTLTGFAEVNAGIYKASVDDGITTVLSNDATVKYQLTIDTQPLSQTVSLGSTLSLSVAASGGASPYTYQWKKGVGNITDATFSSYTKTNFAESDAATYKVLVTDATSSSLLSNGAVINYPLNIDVQPQSAVVTLGASKTLSVSVSGGSGSYTYQWQKNYGDISGATLSTYTINPFHEIDAGTYGVAVGDGLITLLSDDAILSYLLTIDTQPQTQTAVIGSPVSLSVVVSGGSGSYIYQWKKNGSNISGATASTFHISSFAPGDAGSYTVSIFDGTTTLLSNAALLGYGFEIVSQPRSQGTYPGGSVTLSVAVSGGSGSYTYQWQRDSSNILDASNSSCIIDTYNPATNSGIHPAQYAVSTSDGTATLLSNTVQVGTLSVVEGTPTNMFTGNGVPYSSRFIWELDPLTQLPVRVKVENSF